MTETTAHPGFDAIGVDELRRIGSMKWTRHPGALAAFVAEMDFGVPEPVTRAVNDLLSSGIGGYIPDWLTTALQEATAAWHAKTFGWSIEPADVTPTADVIRAYEIAIDHFSRPGSPIVLLTPAYPPFFMVAAHRNRDVIEVPVRLHGDAWKIDFDRLESAFKSGAGLLLLCNPHNPIGKMYTRSELAAIAEIVERYDARVFSDEVHAPLAYDNNQHIPYASVSEAAASHTLTSTSASKAFNIAGLKCAQLITSNDSDRAAVRKLGLRVTHGASTLGVAANAAAYRDGRPWLDDVVAYLDRNRRRLAARLADPAPGPRLGFRPPESTYFAWLDIRHIANATSRVAELRDHYGLVVTDGADFGHEGRGFLRLNFATPRPVLDQMIDVLATALGVAAG